MELFKLWGTIMVDNKEALNQLGVSEKKAKASQKAFGEMGDAAAGIGKAMLIGATAAVAGLTAIALKTIDTASAISDNSKKVGMSAEEYQKWSYAAKLSGVEQDKLTSLMTKQQTSFANATDGAKTQSEAYNKLGIDVKKMSSSDAFNAVIAKLAGMTDETARNSIANDIFGKSYADLAPLLGEGANGIEALKKQAVDLGGVMSNDTVASGDKLGDTIDSLKTMFAGLANTIGASLMPILQTVADWVLANKDTIAEVATKGFDLIKDSIKFVIDNANILIPILVGVVAGFAAFSIITTIQGIMATFTAITTGASGAMAIFNAVMAANPIMMIAIAIGLAIAAVALFIINFEKIKKTVTDVIDKIKEKFNFKWEWPTLKMPHFSITNGSLNPLDWIKNGLPKIGIDWYAKGGIFTSPTLFNTPYGLKGVGEKGPEVVAPMSDLQKYLDSSKESFDYDKFAYIMIKALKGMGIVLDGDIVGSFVDSRILKGAM